jgi:hypothetical protein
VALRLALFFLFGLFHLDHGQDYELLTKPSYVYFWALKGLIVKLRATDTPREGLNSLVWMELGFIGVF